MTKDENKQTNKQTKTNDLLPKQLLFFKKIEKIVVKVCNGLLHMVFRPKNVQNTFDADNIQCIIRRTHKMETFQDKYC